MDLTNFKFESKLVLSLPLLDSYGEMGNLLEHTPDLKENDGLHVTETSGGPEAHSGCTVPLVDI